uniref:Uncharacterized protein n=1 Tax=Zea mays TaxID=4577 RepID=A0A804QPK6_MAIZE
EKSTIHPLSRAAAQRSTPSARRPRPPPSPVVLPPPAFVARAISVTPPRAQTPAPHVHLPSRTTPTNLSRAAGRSTSSRTTETCVPYHGAEQAAPGAGRGEGPDEHRAGQGRQRRLPGGGPGRGHRQGHQAQRVVPRRRAPHPGDRHAHPPLPGVRRLLRVLAVAPPRAHPELGGRAQDPRHRAPPPRRRGPGVRAGGVLRHAPRDADAQHVRLLRQLPRRRLGLLRVRPHLRRVPRRLPRVPDAGQAAGWWWCRPARRWQAAPRGDVRIPREPLRLRHRRLQRETRGRGGRRGTEDGGSRGQGPAHERDDGGSAARQGQPAASSPRPVHRLPPCRRGQGEPSGGGLSVPADQGERAALLRAHGGDGHAHRAVRGDGDRGLRARARPLLRSRQADGGARDVLRVVQGRLRVPPVRRAGGGGGRHAEEAGTHGRVHPRQARRGLAAEALAAGSGADGKPRASPRRRGQRRHERDQGPSSARGAGGGCGARGKHSRESRARCLPHRGRRPGRGGGRLPEPQRGRHVRPRARAAAGAGAVRRQRSAGRQRVPRLLGGLGDGAGAFRERARESARPTRRRPQHVGAGRDVQPRGGGDQRADDVLRQRQQRGSAATTRAAHARLAGASRRRQRRSGCGPFRGVGAGASADVCSDVRHADEAPASDAGAADVATVRQERNAAGGIGNAKPESTVATTRGAQLRRVSDYID